MTTSTVLSTDFINAVMYRIRSLVKAKSHILNTTTLSKKAPSSITNEELSTVLQKTNSGQFTGVNANIENSFPNNGNTLLVIHNTSTGEAVITFNPSKLAWVETVPAGETRSYGPFYPEAFNNGTGQTSYIVTSPVEVAVANFQST